MVLVQMDRLRPRIILASECIIRINIFEIIINKRIVLQRQSHKTSSIQIVFVLFCASSEYVRLNECILFSHLSVSSPLSSRQTLRVHKHSTRTIVRLIECNGINLIPQQQSSSGCTFELDVYTYISHTHTHTHTHNNGDTPGISFSF